MDPEPVKVITLLPESYNIVVKLYPLAEPDPTSPTKYNGTIDSKVLKADFTSQPTEPGRETGIESIEDQTQDAAGGGMADAIESFILACACNDMDLNSPQFINALQTTIDACANALD